MTTVSRKWLLAAFIAAVAACSTVFGPGPAQAQAPVKVCVQGVPNKNNCIPVDSNNPFPVSGSISATISGFAQNVTGTPFTATEAGATGNLPVGNVVVATNVGTVGAFCQLGGSSSTSGQYISAGGGWFAFTVDASTQLSCKTAATTGNTTINLVGGTGIPTGTGGGGGSGGGGGAATLAAGAVSSGAYVSGSIMDGAIVALGAVADVAWVSGSGTLIALTKNLAAALVTTNADLGPPGATACATDTGSCSINALLQRIAQRLTTAIGGTAVTVANGADTTLGAVADAAWASGNGTVVAILKTISGSGTTIGTNTGAISTNTGSTNTNLGAPGATVCATDTGSCSVNALLQRIAQRLTTAIGGTVVTTADGGQTTIGTTSDAAYISGAGTVISLLKALVASPTGSTVTTWAGSTLGAISNYGTSPGAVIVPAMNSFMTGAANFAASSAAVPATLAAVGVSDGSTSCSGGPCLIAPKALSSGVAGTPSTDFLSVQSSQTAYPVSVGGTSAAVLGSYCLTAKTGLMAAGLASGAPVFSFRTSTSNIVVVNKVLVSASDVTTAFVAGAASFDLFVARGFTASDTGGSAVTLTGNTGKLRTSFANAASNDVADFRSSSTATLTAGTRTLDGSPLASVMIAIPTSIDTQMASPGTELFRTRLGEQPLQFSTNEGFVIVATVPGTGTWSGAAQVCWDVMSAF